MRGDATTARTDINHRPGPRCENEFGERSKDCTVDRFRGDLGPKEVFVVGGHDVVGRPGRAQMGRFIHAGNVRLRLARPGRGPDE